MTMGVITKMGFKSEFELINNKTVIKNKLKDLASKLEKFKAQTILVIECQKIHNHNLILKFFIQVIIVN